MNTPFIGIKHPSYVIIIYCFFSILGDVKEGLKWAKDYLIM